MQQDDPVFSDKYVIDLSKPWHVSWWAVRFGISEPALRAAVAQAGDSPAAVRMYLQNSLNTSPA
jgi:hypothetical protein